MITKKIAEILELSYDNHYVEVMELKKNKTFIAKKSDTHEEEKNVAEKAPVKNWNWWSIDKQNWKKRY